MATPAELAPSIQGNVARKAPSLVNATIHDEFGTTLFCEDVTEKIEIWREPTRDDQKSLWPIGLRLGMSHALEEAHQIASRLGQPEEHGSTLTGSRLVAYPRMSDIHGQVSQRHRYSRTEHLVENRTQDVTHDGWQSRWSVHRTPA